MKKIIKSLENLLATAFEDAGFQIEPTVVVCGMPALGDFQCNSALAGAKQFATSPMVIAQKVLEHIPQNNIIESASLAKPGFVNIFLKKQFLAQAVQEAYQTFAEPLGFDYSKTIVDFGGPNVAKPLHVGHLRSGTIGESIKRIAKFVGNEVIGDIHLGDWGLQMGMIISALEQKYGTKNPDWPYFDPDFNGEYPSESPITIKDLETIYPAASAAAKADEALMRAAQKATVELQNKRRGYYALWQHIMAVSKADLMQHYQTLNISFDLWLGESDAQPYCTQVIDMIMQKGIAYESQGALVIDVAKPDDKIEMPPFMLKKSDGGMAYSTTDLATIFQRDQDYQPDRMIYVVDKRQGLHFEALFRAVERAQITNPKIKYDFAGFGTMNGKDGKPYKTRDGGVMQLGVLIADVKQKALEKITEAKGGTLDYSKDEIQEISNKVAVAALKFADLSIFRTKDYVFDVDKFCSFEGKTGPYLLYTATRAKSILKKANFVPSGLSNFDVGLCGKEMLFALLDFKSEVVRAYQELAPSVVCDFVYRLANLFNSFYNSCNIINEKDSNKKAVWLNLTHFVLITMEKALDLLGIETLEKM